MCLDQLNGEEKGIQIPLMGAIYQCAKKVHIWLGEPHAEDRIQELFASFKGVAMLRKVPNETDDQRLEHTHDTLRRICGDDFEAQIICFFSRQWFKRRWILQECALNTVIDVRCGEYKLAWSWFIKAVSPMYLLSSSGGIELTQDAVNALELLFQIPTALDSSLLESLWAFPDSNCKEAKDRIFALLGMAIDLYKFEGLKYAKSWNETFTDVAKIYYDSEGIAMFKHLACFGSISYPGSPSWVPDWRNPQPHLIFGDEDSRYGGRGWDQHFRIGANQELVINGWYRGAVRWTDDTTSDSASRLASCIPDIPHANPDKDFTIRLLLR